MSHGVPFLVISYVFSTLTYCPVFGVQLIGDNFRVFFNEKVLIDKRLYELYFKDNWLIASINSTIFAMFVELGARTGLGDGLLDLTVYEVGKIYIIDLSTSNIEFDNFKNRKINNIYVECGFSTDLEFRSQIPNPLLDRKALDDLVFNAIGLSRDERNEVYWVVCELVQQRLAKAGSVR